MTENVEQKGELFVTTGVETRRRKVGNKFIREAYMVAKASVELYVSREELLGEVEPSSFRELIVKGTTTEEMNAVKERLSREAMALAERKLREVML